jgi:hypothetical protein
MGVYGLGMRGGKRGEVIAMGVYGLGIRWGRRGGCNGRVWPWYEGR